MAIYYPILVLIQASNASVFGGAPIYWVLASVIGLVPFLAVFGVARAGLLRHGDPRPLKVIAVYVLATIAQGLTFAFVSVLVGAADEPHLSFRLTGVLLQVPLLATVGYAVARHDAHRRVMGELEGTRKRLSEVGQALDTDAGRAEAELSSAVRATLDPALQSLEVALTDAESGGDRAGVIGELDALVEERVRPLARDLTLEREIPGEEITDSIPPRARVPLPRRFRLGEAIRPDLAALILLFTAAPSAIRVLEPGGILVYLLAFPFFVWSILELIRRLTGSVRVPTVLGLPAAICLYIAAGSGAFWLTGAVGVVRPEGIALAIIPAFALLGLAFTVDLLVETRRTRSEAELEVETIRLRQTVALIRRRERLLSRRLAFVVHGALQGALNAAALRIAEAGEVTSQLGQEIRRDIAAAVSQIEGLADRGSRREPGEPLKTSTTIEELSSVWSGRRRFSVNIEPPVEEALSGDPEVDEAVAEVIREAVNNAFRHGVAVTVEVEVGVVEADSPGNPREVAITVRDDGEGPSGSSEPGFGSSLFDDLCGTWALETDGLWTVLDARVNLDNQRAPMGLTFGAGSGPSDRNISAAGRA